MFHNSYTSDETITGVVNKPPQPEPPAPRRSVGVLAGGDRARTRLQQQTTPQ